MAKHGSRDATSTRSKDDDTKMISADGDGDDESVEFATDEDVFDREPSYGDIGRA